MSKVVVIGAGVAGLAAAIRLADFGHDVTVVENAPAAGGQLGPLDTHDTHDVSSSVLITLPAVLRDLFRKTGRPLERCLGLAPAGQAHRYIFDDGTTLDLPNASRAGTLDALDSTLKPGAGAEWDAVIRYGGAVWEDLRAYLGRPLRQRDVWKLRTSRLFRGTLGDVAGRHLTDDRLTAMLGSYATSIGTQLRTAPAAVAALAYLEQTFGLWRVDGGATALTDALLKRADEKAVTLRFETPASQIVLDGNRATGVTTGEERIAADVVVSTVNPDRLLPHRPHEPPPGPSVLSVAAMLAPDAPALPERTIIASDATTPEIMIDASPGNRHVVLHMPAYPQEPTATALQVEQMLQRANDRGIRVEPKARAVRTPQDLGDATGAPGGRIYGESWLRTGKASSASAHRIRGVYAAGSITHPGPMIPFAVMSADIVSDLIGRA